MLEPPKFLVHEVSRHGIRQDPGKLKGPTELPELRVIDELRQVLGIFSYCRKFVKQDGVSLCVLFIEIRDGTCRSLDVLNSLFVLRRKVSIGHKCFPFDDHLPREEINVVKR